MTIFRPSDLITTLASVLMDTFCPCFDINSSPLINFQCIIYLQGVHCDMLYAKYIFWAERLISQA